MNKCAYKYCDNETRIAVKGYETQFCSVHCSNKNPHPEKLFGKRYKHIVVQNEIRYDDNRLTYLCKCDCGKELWVRQNALHRKNGCSTRCGAVNPELFNTIKDLDNEKDITRAMAVRTIHNSYKRGCVKRKLKFELTIEEFGSLIEKPCYYCGLPPSNIEKINKSVFLYNGIDRVNNGDGYLLNNCVPCCQICNFAKTNMSHDNFIEMAFRIANHKNAAKHENLGETMEKLCIANFKLYKLCDDKSDAAQYPNTFSPKEMEQMARKDIELCKERAALKSEINRMYKGWKSYVEVKDYGSKDTN